MYFVPLGIVLETEFFDKMRGSSGSRSFHWWTVPLVPLCVAAAVCLWVGLSYLGLVPRSLAPWSLSSTSVWLDKCCVDQTNIAGFLNGGLGQFDHRSHKMVGFVGPTYCQRLWAKRAAFEPTSRCQTRSP
jgi:hypothetical protein